MIEPVASSPAWARGLRGLLFDAGDVLYHRPRRGQALKALLERHGLKPLPSEDPRLKELRRRSHRGDITREAYFAQRLAWCGVSDAALLNEGIAVLARAQADIELFPGVVSTLQALHRQGIKLGIVTNTHDVEAEKRSWFAPYGIDQLWSSWASSCELRMLKPDAMIYMAALQPLNLAEHEVAFVAHATKELEGACAVGLHTISFNPDEPGVRADAHLKHFGELLPLLGARHGDD
jgi:FMN phosphatase YigB (HAD superfamily)